MSVKRLWACICVLVLLICLATACAKSGDEGDGNGTTTTTKDVVVNIEDDTTSTTVDLDDEVDAWGDVTLDVETPTSSTGSSSTQNDANKKPTTPDYYPGAY